MKVISRSILLLIIVRGAATAQTLPQDFKFPENNQPGETLKIPGTGLDKVKSVTLKAQGKPDVNLPPESVKISPTDITFTVPANASGYYEVALIPGSMKPVPLTVTPVPPTESAPRTERPVIVSGVAVGEDLGLLKIVAPERCCSEFRTKKLSC